MPRAVVARPRQLSLPLAAAWGGERAGAGRKPRAPSLRRTPHRSRPLHRAAHPVHVTLRSAFRPLRSQHVFPSVRRAIRGATRRDPEHFRVLHFSVQFDHIHLLVEATDRAALGSGMRSLVIRVARSVNSLVFRAGPLWADRWHGRALGSPRQVRNALLYVLANVRKHARRPLPPGVDAFSSGAWFGGWRGAQSARGRVAASDTEPGARAGPGSALASRERAVDGDPPISAARTWLARVGWRRHGLLGLDEAPSHAARSRTQGGRRSWSRAVRTHGAQRS